MLKQLAGRLKRIDPTLWRFAITGSLTVLLDAIVYALLLNFGMPVNLAKALGLVAATLFAYAANKFWAFRNPSVTGNRWLPFLILYVLAIGLNVLVNRVVLGIAGEARFAYPLAWFCATAASSTWNYLGLRFFVFRPARDPVP